MINDPMAHFEKLLDEFKEDALAADTDVSLPSSNKRIQYNLTRRNILALVEEIVLENDKLREDAEPDLKEERDLLWQYLYDAVGDMMPRELSDAARLDDLNYCKNIIDKANEYKP
jgi:hypothetical protein